MNQMAQAMSELADMDELAAGRSPVHDRHPLCKLLLTVLYIAVVLSFPKENLDGLVPLMLIPVLWFVLSGIPVSTCFYKLRYILPLVCAVGIWNPVLNRTPVFTLGRLTVTAGMISFLTLLLKGVFALMASFLLIATTNIEKICCAFRMLHVPEILVTQLMITYRYISLLLREAGLMTAAYALRAPGQRGIHISAWGSFAGQLLLRSMDRAQSLYQSMCLRGFHGDFTYANPAKWNRKDTLYLIGFAAAILLLRAVNLSALAGSLLTAHP